VLDQLFLHCLPHHWTLNCLKFLDYRKLSIEHCPGLYLLSLHFKLKKEDPLQYSLKQQILVSLMKVKFKQMDLQLMDLHLKCTS